MLSWMAAGSFKPILLLSDKPGLLLGARIITWDVFVHLEAEEKRFPSLHGKTKCRRMQKLCQGNTNSADRDELQDFQVDNWTIYLVSKLKYNSTCHLKSAVIG